MTNEQRIKNLEVPTHPVDVVMDTDAYNEIDDQFAIAYLLSCKRKLTTKAFYAAPFDNENSTGPADGMEKSYEEIYRMLDKLGDTVDVFRGSDRFLPDEHTPVISPAAEDLAERVKDYSPENPLYVVAIAALTNIASAILLNPDVAENTVVVWLGGHALHYHDTKEFNMRQDIAAARVVMGSGVPFVQLPCHGVVSSFTISKPELEYWMIGKNPVADYLARNAISAADKYASGLPWTRCLWDVTAPAWLMSERDSMMHSALIPMHLPTYDGHYECPHNGITVRYVYEIKRDSMMTDMLARLLAPRHIQL